MRDLRSSPSRGEYAALLLLSLSALMFEVNLTRLFSVAQFYHFAFMIVSLALLGSGASGTFLAVFPRLGRAHPRRSLSRLGLLSGLAMMGSYLLTNGLPFDSFSITVDRRQVFILVAHYAALSLPFFFSGMATSLCLEVYPLRRGQVYAVNLVGSAGGCAAALLLPALAGGEGVLLLCCGLSALAGGAALWAGRLQGPTPLWAGGLRFWLLPAAMLLALGVLGWQLRLDPPGVSLRLNLSPYKGLSYALQIPGARVVSTRWNAYSRVDRVTSPGIRSFPGMSIQYMQPLPPEDAIFIDGNDLSPVVLPGSRTDFAAYMPAAAAFALRPEAKTLILEPRGGMDIIIARQSGAASVTAVEGNPLVVEAAGEAYRLPGVAAVVEDDRSYLRRANDRFDVVALSLTGAYRPVQSGAYSLVEDYRCTVESFGEALQRLNGGGLLVVTRWLQTPPSEELRAFATAVTALEQSGGNPREQIAAFRGYNTLTLLVKRGSFTAAELEGLRKFTAERAYDLVYAPDMLPEEANRFNILPEPIYYLAFFQLLDAQPRAGFYADYPYDIRPPTDDRPFFGHFFKWSQAGAVLAELGRTWQPFGGAGYFAILALLAVALASAGGLILLPVVLARGKMKPAAGETTGAGGRLDSQASRRLSFAAPAYFALIGLAYLLVEMPLIQRFILYLGQPAYAMAAVLFTLLLFSGLGSRWSHRMPLGLSLAGLSAALLAFPSLLAPVFHLTLGLSLPVRLLLTVLLLSPLGLLMGVPFPGGLRRFLGGGADALSLPWVWSINGTASVVAAVLAALLALSFGFGWVLRAGAFCYAGAWLTAAVLPRPGSARSPHR